jgi:hypothetical protein
MHQSPAESLLGIKEQNAENHKPFQALVFKLADLVRLNSKKNRKQI